MRRAALALLAGSLLGACATGSIPVSPSAGPGAALMSPYDAGVIFADVCLIRGSRFQDAADGLRGHDFTQNAATGTYFHNTANLSVKVDRERCSMVFATRVPVDKAVEGLAEGTASMTRNIPDGIDVRSNPREGGLTYFGLGLTQFSDGDTE